MNKKIRGILHPFFFWLSLKSVIFYMYSLSQFGLAGFQVLRATHDYGYSFGLHSSKCSSRFLSAPTPTDSKCGHSIFLSDPVSECHGPFFQVATLPAILWFIRKKYIWTLAKMYFSCIFGLHPQFEAHNPQALGISRWEQKRYLPVMSSESTWGWELVARRTNHD